jgi:pimeloyl-ACP methyl ester carboxylesterase
VSLLRGAGYLVIGVAVVWLALVVLLWVFQRQLIYLPDRSAPEPPPAPVEEVELTTDDGLELSAWFVPADGEPATTVLVTSGNAGNRALRLPLAEGLAGRGHAVLLLEYRGYGGNPGSPSEEGLVADARAAADHLDERDDVDPDRVAYLGESIGTGVAAALAAERPPPAGLVLRSPFPSLADVARVHYPFVPAGTLLRDRFETLDALDGHDGPTLVVAGSDDSIVPADASREVAEVVGADLVVVPDADHNDRALLDGDRYLDAVDAFLRGGEL